MEVIRATPCALAHLVRSAPDDTCTRTLHKLTLTGIAYQAELDSMHMEDSIIVTVSIKHYCYTTSDLQRCGETTAHCYCKCANLL